MNAAEEAESANSINRNIVECKDEFQFLRSIHTFGINRNIVECKVIMQTLS